MTSSCTLKVCVGVRLHIQNPKPTSPRKPTCQKVALRRQEVMAERDGQDLLHPTLQSPLTNG